MLILTKQDFIMQVHSQQEFCNERYKNIEFAYGKLLNMFLPSISVVAGVCQPNFVQQQTIL